MDARTKSDRDFAIEKIVDLLASKKGRHSVLVVSPDHWASVVFAEEVRNAFKKTHLDYESRSCGTLSTKHCRVVFATASAPHNVVGYADLDLLVVQMQNSFPLDTLRALRGYEGLVTRLAFSD